MSVIIPAHNRGHTLRRALESVLGQDIRPSQVIVIDDASTDNTVEVAEQFDEVEILRQSSNAGAGAARTAGIFGATQEWIAFLDSDDEWLPRHLTSALKYQEDTVLISAPGIVPPSSDHGPRLLGNADRDLYWIRQPFDVMDPENRVATSGTLVRTDVAKSVGGFDKGSHAQDLNFWLRVTELGIGVALPEPGFIYYESSGARISDGRTKQRDAAREYLLRYEGRSWFNPSTLKTTAAIRRWDEIREGLHQHRVTTAARLVMWLLTTPRSWPAIVRMGIFRRNSRKLGSYYWDHLPSEVKAGATTVSR